MKTRIIATAPIGEFEGHGPEGFSAEAAFRYARENPNAQYTEVFPGDIEGLQENIAVIYEGDEGGLGDALRAECPDAFSEDDEGVQAGEEEL